MTIKCPRCGVDNNILAPHCISCGKELKNVNKNKSNTFLNQIFGFSELKGKILNINPTYYQPPDFNWNKALIFVILLVPLIYIMFSLFIVIFIIYFILRLGGIKINLFNIFYGVGVLKPSFQKNSRYEMPVQDITVQDSSGKQLVRIKGHLKIGSVSVGDSIYVKGKIKGGMLIFKSGYNHSINSDLKLLRKLL